MSRVRVLCAFGVVLTGVPVAGTAAAARPFAVTEQREPCAEFNPLRNPYFGDLHVHTAYSQDASTQGTRNTPRDAYRFAKGERLGIQPYDDRGRPLRGLQLDRPLDFAAVTDHAELLGETQTCRTPGLPGYDSLVCRIYRRFPRAAYFLMNTKSSMRNPTRFGFCGEDGVHCLQAALTPWREIQAAAEGAYDRTEHCSFTSFVGYEWTGSVDTNNLHRNVIFRNERVPELPASFYEAPTAEGLWRALRRDCLEAGCDALVIPHNSNLSNGLMFQGVGSDGRPLSMASARTQAEFERLVEVMQHKGDSECALGVNTNDELCGFEKLSYANFLQKYLPFLRQPTPPASFVRQALGEGLIQEARLGVNPFQFGLVASTDSHLGTPGAVNEDQHVGHGGAGAAAAKALPRGLPDDLEFNPGGLAGIWAEENSRDALFEALRRREVWGTSGPRIVLRFFGGWSFPADLCASEEFASLGYARGVPMGGELPRSEASAETLAPTFAVWALRDPDPPPALRVPLQRVQIVKGWLEGGRAREVVHNVAGDTANGAGVKAATCETFGSGADELCALWRDPDFDPTERAFYYARVLQNPSCRWSAHVCNAHGVDCSNADSLPPELEPCCDAGHRRTIQERAWSSPIWYAPPAEAAP